MQKKGLGYEYRTTVVCIDSYEDRIPCGRYYNLSEEDGKQFSGVMQFLSQMEKTLDGIGFPQSFTATRSFGAVTGHMPGAPPDTDIRDGKLATFLVRVLFRQNASWQGSVVWTDGGQEQSFRSAMELLFLIDSALGEKDAAS